MIDMKITTKAKTMMGDEGMEYSHGLRIYLDDDSLTKLGFTELPAIDADMKISALACVVSISQNEQQGSDKPNRSVELQIEMMDIKPASEEPGEKSGTPAQSLYSVSKMNP